MLIGILTRPKLMAPFHKTFTEKAPFSRLYISFDISGKIILYIMFARRIKQVIADKKGRL
jgi:hypothetical protein